MYSDKRNILILLLIISVFVIAACAKTGESIKLTSPIQNCKNVQVPYQATEEYQIDMKYEVISFEKESVVKLLDLWARGTVGIRNVDSETGSFTVEQTITTLEGSPRTLSSSQYIMSGETKSFVEEFDVDLGEDFYINYKVSPPKKTLTRTVTKYRTEEVCN